MVTDRAERLSGHVVPSPTLTARIEQPPISGCEIAGRGALVDFGELHVRRSRDSESEESIEECIAKPLVEPVLGEE